MRQQIAILEEENKLRTTPQAQFNLEIEKMISEYKTNILEATQKVAELEEKIQQREETIEQLETQTKAQASARQEGEKILNSEKEALKSELENLKEQIQEGKLVKKGVSIGEELESLSMTGDSTPPDLHSLQQENLGLKQKEQDYWKQISEERTKAKRAADNFQNQLQEKDAKIQSLEKQAKTHDSSARPLQQDKVVKEQVIVERVVEKEVPSRTKIPATGLDYLQLKLLTMETLKSRLVQRLSIMEMFKMVQSHNTAHLQQWQEELGIISDRVQRFRQKKTTTSELTVLFLALLTFTMLITLFVADQLWSQHRIPCYVHLPT